MKNKIVTSFFLSSVVLFSGCASFPDTAERPSLEDSSQDVIDGWSATKPITFRENRYDLAIDSPNAIPDSVRKKEIRVKSPGRISAKDLTYVFDRIGIQTVLTSQEVEETSVYLPSYKGDFGSFIDLMEDATNLSFRWTSGAVVVDDSKDFTVRIAQQKDLTEIIAGAIEKLGADDVFASKEAGTISYSASTKSQKRISDYLNRLSVNTALIQLQLAVINVKLNDQRRTGFDWSALSLKMGDLNLLEDGGATVGNLLNMSGSGAGITFNNDNINLMAALNLLSSFGESRTAQNLTLQTLSGVPVSLTSGDKIPYVSDIPTTVNESSTTSGLDTEIVETGFKVEVEALYDGDESLVTVSMKLDLSSLTGFRELSAGNQLGSVTQPEIQNQELSSIVKLGAGETALLGGLIIETYSDNRKSLAMLERMPAGSQSIDNNQTAVFILLRPTVTVFGGEK